MGMQLVLWYMVGGFEQPLVFIHSVGADAAVRCNEQPWVFMQLETVYVLEGLGPPKDEAAAGRTFADQVLMPLIQPNACPVYTVHSGTYLWLEESRLHCIGVLHHMTCKVTHLLPAAVGMHRAVSSIRSAFKWQQGHRSEAHEHVIHECQLACKGLYHILLQHAQWALVAGTTAWTFGRLRSISTGTG